MQTAYSGFRRIGIIGQRTDSGPGYVSSKLSKKPDNIPFGTLVVWEGNNLCGHPRARKKWSNRRLALRSLIAKGHTIHLQRRSAFCGKAACGSEAMSDVPRPGADVYVRFQADGENTAIGGLSAAEGAGLARLKGALFLEAARQGEPVELEIDLMGGRS